MKRQLVITKHVKLVTIYNNDKEMKANIVTLLLLLCASISLNAQNTIYSVDSNGVPSYSQETFESLAWKDDVKKYTLDTTITFLSKNVPCRVEFLHYNGWENEPGPQICRVYCADKLVLEYHDSGGWTRMHYENLMSDIDNDLCLIFKMQSGPDVLLLDGYPYQGEPYCLSIITIDGNSARLAYRFNHRFYICDTDRTKTSATIYLRDSFSEGCKNYFLQINSEGMFLHPEASSVDGFECSNVFEYELDNTKFDAELQNLNKDVALKSFFMPHSIIKNYNIYKVSSIRDSAFVDCTSLTSVTIPGSVKKTGEYSFRGCKNLTSATLQEGIPYIDTGMFCNCEKLTSISIPESVTHIWSVAFDGCKSLASLTLPSKLAKIEGTVFRNCQSLKTITCLAITPPELRADGTTFNGFDRSQCTLIVPKGCKSKYSAADGWKEFKEIREL